MLRSIGRQCGDSVVKKEEERLRWEGDAETEGFKPGMKE